MNKYHMYTLDENNNPVGTDDVRVWGMWWQTANRHVKLETINGHLISTVFLGLDHGYGDSVPILFETMIEYMDGRQDVVERYSTWDEAIAGHLKHVEDCINGNYIMDETGGY